MKFTNREDYENQRNALLASAEEHINSGELDKANDIMDVQIPELDNAFKDYATAQANLKALSGQNAVSMSKIVENGIIAATSENGGLYGGIEYRKAFMDYVLTGKTISPEFKNGGDVNTKTSDAGAIIPTTIMEKIIEKMETVGNILPLVTQTSYKGGLSVPTSSAKPTATWLAEGESGIKQKKSTGNITFSYYKLKCVVSVSLETDTTTLPVFEKLIINNVSEAMIKALENAIINGTGSGQPKGILKETVPTGQNVDIAKTGSVTYKTLCDMEAALPQEYEDGAVYLMTKKTFMEFVGITDSNGQPVARVNYGIGGKPERTLLGRPVICNNHMSNYAATVSSDTIVAAIFKMSDYLLNTNLQMTVKTYEDNDTDDKVTKAVMVADGKAVDVNSLVTLTKKSA